MITPCCTRAVKYGFQAAQGFMNKPLILILK